MDDLYALIMTRAFISALAAGVLTIAICFVLNLIVMPFTRLKGVSKAEAEGRVVRAVLVKTHMPGNYDSNESGVHTLYTGVFQYEYKGKTYKYRGNYYRFPPSEEKLYFRSDPSKARTDAEYGRLESEWKMIFPVLMVCCFIGTFFLL